MIQLFLLHQREHKYLILLVRDHIVSVFMVKFITKPATYIRLKVNLDNFHSLTLLILKCNPNPTVNMILTRHRNRDRRCYDMSNVNEVAIIFNNTDGETPFEKDFRVYHRNQEFPFINLNILSLNLDLITLTLFIPYGEPG